ncbi:hypothetical protein BS47DRAFT_1470334 [Hydnum rufescens UP504]|uniref:HECT-type E3 ubiquitin transferase n=1 Tax=Hydnum rufescens UP504 TaxID=1448309 RepID=A0A9P6ASU2_9AGAM|nr:hypothetical protein BS47DRAFT_1470334 [Hydnum rufescens UP504]
MTLEKRITLPNPKSHFDGMVTIELKSGGVNIPATEENNKENVKTVIEYCAECRAHEEFDASLPGSDELTPQELINVLNKHELELPIGGTSDIDANDWTKLTAYREYRTNDEVIHWSGQVTQSWSIEHKSQPP